MSTLTEQEQTWVSEALETQQRLLQRTTEQVEIKKLRSQAEAGRELGKQIARGELRRLEDRPASTDQTIRKQVEHGSALAKKINARYFGPAGR